MSQPLAITREEDTLSADPSVRSIRLDQWDADLSSPYQMVQGDTLAFLETLPEQPLFDLVVTSPPYNIGKSYEKKESMDAYLDWHRRVIDEIILRLKPGGSLCWQVGNYVHNGEIFPLDIEFAPFFRNKGLKLRNRIVWRYGHGLHMTRRFTGRYEVIMWYTKGDGYTFNLDAVRVPSKYPGKRHYKGPNKGKLSGNPLGKNPEDVWEIPSVNSNHVEKTDHPCQFPVGLVERLVLALSNKGDVVFDPFAGVGSAGVAAAVHGRKFLGTELMEGYTETAVSRIKDALLGRAAYRPHSKQVYDFRKSNLSAVPDEWTT